MRYGSVCSGVEAASLAWMPLGWECAFMAEVEPFPCSVLMQKFGATKPLRPLDPAEATDEKDRKTRESWRKQIDRMPGGGTIPNLGDFTKIRKDDYAGHIDLLVGGTPCQDVSVAGKRAGFGDEGKRETRSSLALDFVRLAYESGCEWVVWENVPGVFSSNGGRDFATLLSWFVGYRIEPPKDGWKSSGIVRNTRPDRFGLAWRVLDAQFTRTPGFPNAIPQRRRRVFLVGHFGDWTRAASVLLEPGRVCWDSPARVKTREEIAGPVGTGSDCANGVDRLCATRTLIRDSQFDEVAGTLKGQASGGPCPERGQTVVCETGKGFYREDESAGTLEQHEDQHRRNIVCFHGSQDTITNETHVNAIGRNGGLENCICQYGPVAGTLKAKHDGSPCADNGMNVVCYDNQTYARNPEDTGPICCTLRGNMGTGGNTVPLVQNAIAISANVIGRKPENGGHQLGVGGDVAFTQDTCYVMGVSYRQTVRRLIPVECERLMGFPDNHTLLFAWKGKNVAGKCPDGPRYKACGNSMCVNCMEWIGRQIQNEMEKL